MSSPALNLQAPRAIASSWPRFAAIGLLLVAGAIVAVFLDEPIARQTVNDTVDGFERSDLARTLRIGGFLPFWLVVAVMIAAHKRETAGSWRQVFGRPIVALPAATIGAGILAEVVKILARRKRPILSAEWYDFRPFGDRLLDTGGLSMPSSHTIIAFAAAFTLGRLYPGARWLFVLFAVGTAYTRVHSGAHYVTDVYASTLLAWLCAWAVWHYPWPMSDERPATLLPHAATQSA